MRYLIAALLVSAAAPAMAQPAAPARVAQEPPRGIGGTVVSAGDAAVVLRQKDGTEQTVAMTPGWTVSRPRKGGIGDVHIGDFVASASKDAGAGRGVANEVRVMEPGYRPEYGTHAMGQPETSMTHGFVFGIAKAAGGTELTVAYPDGKRTILVPDGMAVTISDLLPRSAAGQGVAVTGVTRASPDGVRRASRLTLP
ncbi:hypothetical protein H7F51_12185 [Novosphingobium flavum]|uniref:DUF5666 domain-containing protein n=1 Tax=Novosphingobium flavum TaxID=1778672 RepID=A0A7X1FSQ9_9SPHN|nr:hypothetical protein [Novosphingobium flavum]MBC2666278.1 hypothetical protein [Novosphingobium flavum]